MKTPHRIIILSSIIACSAILQGCTDSDESVTYQDISHQYNPTRVQTNQQIYYQPSETNQPIETRHNPSGYYYTPPSNDQPSYNAGQGSAPATTTRIEYYDKDAPAASSSVDYNKSVVTTPTVRRQGDLEWVKSQQPGGYTIEVANDPKRSKVAYSVFKSPKSQRSVQFGYKSNDQKMYTGVYGTFKTKEEAQQALDALPPEVKQSATVQQWQNVQTKAASHESDDRPSVESPAARENPSEGTYGNQ